MGCSIFLTIFFIGCAKAAATSTTVYSGCMQANEQYYDNRMSPICDRNCQDLSRDCRMTTLDAVAGCYCRNGYARNLQQQCITLQQCVDDCFPNEYAINHTSQQYACEYVCQANTSARAVSSKRLCYNTAERKCICKSGFCRNQQAQCIRKE